ncbi:MAG: EAL domain-containing protein [Sphingomonadales bacterium]|nr:MAG: EAL domain-containing protein [Sphingomonadales bacterium]
MATSATLRLGKRRDQSFLARVAFPAIMAVATLAVALTAVVLLSASQANKLAGDRQQALVETVLKQRSAAIAHDQEGVTIWDEALRQVTASPPDFKWLDDNLGVWLHSYYGHDEAYVLDASGAPIYAMRDGKRTSPDGYRQRVGAVAAPLVRDLGHKLTRPLPHPVTIPQRTPDSYAIARVGGHPAIISVKAILDEEASITPLMKPPFHVSVRRLDGSFLTEFAEAYQLTNARFETSLDSVGSDRAAPLVDRTGNTLGYIVWEPFGPGALMARRIAPFAIGALVIILAMVGWLLLRIRRSTLALEASEAQAQHLAFHDPLTGLANRALFDDRLGHILADAQTNSAQVALLYFDLDRFKQVNDTLGHPAGDELIVATARRLVEVTRETDVVARIGGDEFAVIQTGAVSAASAEILCLRIIEAVGEPFDLAGSKASVGVSIGVALSPADATTRTELARKADIALYEAKAAGRGRYMLFREQMDAGVRHRRQIEVDLRNAIDAGDQLRLEYQPLYAAHSGQIVGAEALLRWQHPVRGMMSPATFIPIAEASGLISRIGGWVLENACADAVRLRLPTISVNVSAVQLRDEGLAEEILAILKCTRLEPSRLEIEITETSFIESASACQATLVRLRAAGVRIALDDFGTGYSSFSHLRNFEVDRIKIDQSFVNGIDMRRGGSAIIRAIVDLAKASGMQITAEGVETDEQRNFLADAGCTSLQGYLLSRPLSPAAIASLLYRNPSLEMRCAAAK